MQKRSFFQPVIAVAGSILAAAGLLAGCFDMPIIEGASVPVPPKVVLGPYLTDAPDGDGFELRFRTNRRVTAGLRFERAGRLYRFASGDLDHVIRLTNMQPGEVQHCRIWLDDVPGPSLAVLPPPAKGEAVTVAFLGGAVQDPELVSRAGAGLSGQSLNGIVITQDLFGGKTADLDAWRDTILSPLGKALTQCPIFFPPGTQDSVPRELIPIRKAVEAVWRRELGCVYFLGVDARILRNESEAPLVLDWLDKAIAARPATTAWTVLVLSEPLLSDAYVNARALKALGARLERGGVDLVVSGGTPVYHRTLPMTLNGKGPVRYVVTAGLRAAPEQSAGREYTAAQAAVPHVAFLSADSESLQWRVRGLFGGQLDSFRLAASGESDTGDPAMDKQAVLSDALAVATLRREVLAMARQLARAVDNPRGPQEIEMRVLNPSTRDFTGTLTWSLGDQPAWSVEPRQRSFRLESGQAGTIAFRLVPQGGRDQPNLLIDVPGIGYARHELLLIDRKEATVPLVAGKVVADGRFSEATWKGGVELADFQVLHSLASPAHVVRCSAVAADNGFALGLRCEAWQPNRMETKAKRRDGPVTGDESVELYIDTTRQAREYLQFAVNVKNERLDRSSRLGLAWDPPWSSQVRFGRTEDGIEYYNVEILIPYRSLGLSGSPQPGDRWALNIVRNDSKPNAGESVASETVQWAPTFGSNARSGCYGIVTFVKPGQ